MISIGASFETASGVPASASAKPSDRASTTAPAPPFGYESCDTAMAVRTRSFPARRTTGSGGGLPTPPPLGAETVTGLLVPVIDDVTVSVTVTVCVPGMLNVTENVC